MKKTILSVLSLIWIAAILSTGCEDTVTQDDIDSATIPASNVSFSKHIQPVFNVKCNFTGCHNTTDRAGGLALTSYIEVTSNISVVVPGDSETSVMVWTINREAGGRNMPPLGYPALTQNQIDGITTWIDEGAQAN